MAKPIVQRKKIMVVDDDLSVQDALKIIFESAGYDVELEANPYHLLKKNFSAPDLFLIDKLLSGVNGLDMCRHLKGDNATKHVPVIMISASPGIGEQSVDAGADDYIEKPFDRNHLLKVVARNLLKVK